MYCPLSLEWAVWTWCKAQWGGSSKLQTETTWWLQPLRSPNTISSPWGSILLVLTAPPWCPWEVSWWRWQWDSRTIRRWSWSSPLRTSQTISPSGASTSSGATSQPSPASDQNSAKSTPPHSTDRLVVFPPLGPWQIQRWAIWTSMVT